jgi:Bacterial Ig-like domain (group 3)
MRTRFSTRPPIHSLVRAGWTRSRQTVTGLLFLFMAVVSFPGIAHAVGTATPAQLSLAFNPAAVGVASGSAQQLTASFSATGSDTLTADLHYGTDFAAGTIKCTASGGNQTCTVLVSFMPTLPGARKDALFLKDGSTILAMVYLGGVGQSPQAMVQPGVVTQLVSGATYPQGQSAVDENGTVYVISPTNPSGSNVYSVTRNGVESVVPVPVVAPTSIAIDGAGILYISHSLYSDQLITWNTVTQTQGTLIPWPPDPAVACTLNELLSAVTVDSLGNLFTLELNCGEVVETRANGTFVANVIDPAMNANPDWIAVDSSDNAFFSCIDQINEELANGNQSAVTNPGDPETSNLAVDAADSLYVSPHAGGGVVELPASNYQASQGALDSTATPEGLGLGSDGTLYVGNPGTAAGVGNGDLDKVDRSQGAIAFGQQVTGVASASQNVSLYNGGNEPLSISTIVLTGAVSGFAIQPAAVNNCTNGLAIEPGALCQVAVTLTPANAGTLTGSIEFMTNSLNDAASIQTVALSGSAPGSNAMFSPNPVSFGSEKPQTTSAVTQVTLSNTGTQTLTNIAARITGTDPSQFAMTTGANTCGSSLAAGATCFYYITFTPPAQGSYSATLSLADNAYGSPQVVTLTGEGVYPAAVLNVAETIHTNDSLGPLLSATMKIAELIHTSDAPIPTTSASLNIAEIIHTSDAQAAATGAFLNINEIIQTTDLVTGNISLTPTQTLLSSSVNPSVAGQSVTFTAIVSAAASTPNGTVQFMVNGVAVGTTVSLNASGQATYSTTALADGSSSVTADYEGSSAFTSSTSAAVAQSVLDFVFTNSGSTQSATVSPGESAQFTFALDPKGSFGGTIVFSASGLPPGATATFNPASLTPESTATDVVMTVQTAQSSAAAQPALPWSTKSPLLLGLLVPLFAIRPLRRVRNRRGLPLTALVSLGFVLAITGCGGGGSTKQAPVTYPITVTATSGSLQHTVTVNLTVE